MKKIIASVLCLVLALSLAGCGKSKIIEGSEKIYQGIVSDLGMSVVNEGSLDSRAYIIIVTEDNSGICFWLEKNCESLAAIGDNVTIESAIEEQTDLLVALSITVK